MILVASPSARLGRRFRIFLLAVALVAVSEAAQSKASSDASAFLNDLTDRAIAQLTRPGIGEEEREARFRVLMNEGFDIRAIGRFVLGRYWRRAGEAEQVAFLAVFEDMIVRRFLPLFADYSGEIVQFGVVRQSRRDPRMFMVASKLPRKEGPPVGIDWQVRRTDGRFKILDIVAEGVSIAITLRSEYGTVLKRNGGNVGALTKTLREKIANL